MAASSSSGIRPKGPMTQGGGAGGGASSPQVQAAAAIQGAVVGAMAKAGPPQRAPSLSNAPPELRRLRDDTRKELVDCLDSVRGPKALVLDPKLIGPLGLIAEVALLREHHVEKIHNLLPSRMDTPCPNVVYMCRPRVEYMKYIADHIHCHAKEGGRKHFFIFFVPRKSMIAERILEEEGVYGDLTVGSFNLDLIPFDDDLLSLELDGSFRECFLDGDPTSLFHVARSLMKLQDYFGMFPKILGIGDSSKLVKDMLIRMRNERGPSESSIIPEIESLILIDRQVDMVTPMVTQQTFEEMVVPPDKEGAPPPPAGKKVTYPLNSNDIVFSEFRDQNFDALAARIRSKAKHIKDAYDQLQALQNMHELRAFITTLPQTKQQEVSLSVLSNIAHKIAATGRSDDFSRKIDSERVILSGSDPTSAIAFIDELIDRQGPLVKVLRLLTLLSSIHGGLSGKHFEHYQRELLQTYGYEQLFTLHNLVRLGLIKRQGGPRSGFQVAHKPMRLWVPEVDKSEPEDIAFAYSGYAPLSVRLVQYAAAPGWRAMADVIRGISPTAFEVTQSLPPSIAANLSKKNRASAQQGLDKPPITLVFFIGGVTFGEIAALRYLATHSETKRNILIATTKLVNGDSLISSLMDAIPIPTLED